REDSRRRLILDGVYSFGLPLPPLVKRLLETDQVIYVDSLSKGWLHEHVFGVAVIPERDFHIYAERFRNLEPDRAKLADARELLTTHGGFPALITREIDERRHALEQLIRSAGLGALTTPAGYFIPIEADPLHLVAEYGLLTIPGSVFV